MAVFDMISVRNEAKAVDRAITRNGGRLLRALS